MQHMQDKIDTPCREKFKAVYQQIHERLPFGEEMVLFERTGFHLLVSLKINLITWFMRRTMRHVR